LEGAAASRSGCYEGGGPAADPLSGTAPDADAPRLFYHEGPSSSIAERRWGGGAWRLLGRDGGEIAGRRAIRAS